MALVLSRCSGQKVLGFLNRQLLVVLTFTQRTDHSVTITVSEPGSSEVLKQTVELLETLPIGYASTVTFYGKAKSWHGQKRGKFSFNGPLKFWRDEMCPNNEYPPPKPSHCQ